MARRTRSRKEPVVEEVESSLEDENPETESEAEAEAELTESIPEIETKEESPKSEDDKPKVDLRVFSQVSGKKWDQMAGFQSWAKRMKLGPRSIPEWRETFKKFMNTPVK